ncbi:GNAT family N-acetyltransferase [Actinoplanes sp. TBRC 11911]|uniref:GNAT family N-acetyltransferase n=1 Tax=Actinoplanes sp. TBRC 11911 TaxID=2729386 RepID=UPI00145DCBC2|nr:GNAT family N-acetyltransferase [Actinoplanes sp. TBRC 11911]NMO52063.1 GNAT family N-acetyltransferase [Actinoplanes sp. TBRC 11911]
MVVSVEALGEAADAFEIDRAAWEMDYPDIPHPTLREFRKDLALPDPGIETEHYLGLLDGVAVGHLAIQIPRRDNLDNLLVKLAVHPARRRCGVGRALFGRAVQRARELGRKNVAGESVRHQVAGSAFATAMGATAVLDETRSRLDLPPGDPGRLDEMLAEAREHASDYRVVRWDGVPPDEIIDSVAVMLGSFLGEAPLGDLAWEAMNVDADRLREDERRRIERGRIVYNTGAVHDGRVVALTSIMGSLARPEHAWQSITLVDPAHRGHRLGLLVKLVNLAYARERQPGLAAIDTFNAGSNEHMVRINRAMGFRPVGAVSYWQWTG